MSRPTHLSAADSAWLAMERPENLMVVTGVLRLEGVPDLAALRAVVQQRLVGAYPSFSRRVVRSGRWPRRRRWVEDVDFDLAHHVRPHRVPGGVDDCTLTALVGNLMGHPMDPARSPWQLHVVTGEGPRSAVVARVHHCMADGIALATVLLSLLDDLDPDSQGRSEIPGGGRPSRGRAHRSGPVEVLKAVGGAIATLVRVVGWLPEPPSAARGRLARTKRAAWTQPRELAPVKAAAAASGASVNDLLLAATAGGLRRQLLSRGEPAVDIRVCVPANLRPGGAQVAPTLGNRFGIVFVQLPVSEPEPVARLRAVTARTATVKASSQAPGTFLLLALAGALPRPVATLAAWLVGSAASVVVTNVPGPQGRLSLAGRPVESVVFWVPQVGAIGVGVSIFTYAGTVTLGVAADAALGIDPAELARAIDDDLETLVRRTDTAPIG